MVRDAAMPALPVVLALLLAALSFQFPERDGVRHNAFPVAGLLYSSLAGARLRLALDKIPAARQQSASPTFARDVAPILYQHCAACHHPGEVAPFPLLTYRDAAKRAKLIATVTASRYMPPWQPEPGYGHFQGERRLSDADIATLRRWAEAGAPEGDPAQLPPPPHFPEGWQLGTPDMTIRMPKPFPDRRGRSRSIHVFRDPAAPHRGQVCARAWNSAPKRAAWCIMRCSCWIPATSGGSSANRIRASARRASCPAALWAGGRRECSRRACRMACN